MPLVTGNEEEVEGSPGQLNDDSLKRVQDAIHKKMEEREKEKRKQANSERNPYPNILPHDYDEREDDVFWSESLGRWACRSKANNKPHKVWERGKWWNWEEYEYSAFIPELFDAVS